MGAFAPGDTRVFTFLQYDAAGNVSVPSEALRAVPSVVGLGTQAAAARLAAAGFRLGNVQRDHRHRTSRRAPSSARPS